jgi:hypothetical protein
MHFVLARETGEEGTQSQFDWGGEGNEVKVPSSPSCVPQRVPLLPLRRRRHKKMLPISIPAFLLTARPVIHSRSGVPVC